MPEHLEWLDEPEPPLAAGDEFYLTAFHQLSTCRQLGWSIGPIPWRDIVDYGTRYGLEPNMLHDFTQIVFALDRAYLAWQEAHRPGRK